MKLAVTCGMRIMVMRVIFAMFVMILVPVIGRVIVVILVSVIRGVIVMCPVIMVLLFAFECRAGLNDAALGGFGQNKQRQRLRKFCNGGVNAGAVLSGFGFIFKAYDIGTRCMQLHRNLLPLKSNVQMANPVFVCVQLTDLFGQCGRRNKGGNCDQRQNFHMSILSVCYGPCRRVVIMQSICLSDANHLRRAAGFCYFIP